MIGYLKSCTLMQRKCGLQASKFCYYRKKIEKISMAEGAGPSSGALEDAEKQFDAFEEEDEKDEGDTNLVLEDCNERIFRY